jgi:hypothetical protein
MEKKCSKCQKILPLEDFAKDSTRKNGRRSECKNCYNLRFRQYFADKNNMQKQIERVNKRKIKWKYKFDQHKIELGCKICGYNKCARALHFHHIDGSSDKNFILSKARSLHFSLEKIEKELEKCVVLCSNCHAEVHANLINLDDYIKE